MRVIVLLLLILNLVGCVGTVTETATPFTDSNKANDIPLDFLGIQEAKAISDTRIEVFFYPAVGGSGKYTYDLQVGGGITPVSYSSEVLNPDYRGLLKITLKNLSRLSEYQLRVEVRDAGSTQQSNSNVVLPVTTFENQVAVFDGVLSAYNMPGQDGKDSVKLRWNPAKASSNFPQADSDPASYEIIFLDALRFTPGDFDLDKAPSDGRWKFDIPDDPEKIEKVIYGLPEKTKFYVRMRAIHIKSVYNQFKPWLRGEQNTNYATISTLSGSITDLVYNQNSFKLSLATGAQGLNAINSTWDAPVGVFDHYRLYYWKKIASDDTRPNLPAECLSPYLSSPAANVWCKKVDYNLTQSVITGLDPYQFYGASLVICGSSGCAQGDYLNFLDKTIKTDPITSSFSGINTVVAASKLSELGSVKITYNPPDFSNGYFDGLVLKVRRSVDPGPEVEVEDAPTNNNTTYFLPYDFINQDEITVKGLDYLSENPYCFNLHPFKWSEADDSLKVEYDNGLWKCPVLTIKAPSATEFTGLKSASTLGDIVTLNWGSPSAGLFSHYEVFWTKNSGTVFNWVNAISDVESVHYGRRLIDALELAPNTNIPLVMNLFEAGSYSFGVITYYSYITPAGLFIKRSDRNNEVYSCVIQLGSTQSTNCQKLNP